MDSSGAYSKTSKHLDLRYPRPLLKRDRYQLLDGNWTLNGSPIRVPYPPESKASGFKGTIRDAGGHLVYETNFMVPEEWSEDTVLLHFGAVDQLCDVYLDDLFLGHHEGGYLGFSFDLGRLSSKESHCLRVVAEDSLDPVYPYGKQTHTPGGMWYTPVSGIWQSVWIEPVPPVYISSLKMQPTLTHLRLRVWTSGRKTPDPNEEEIHLIISDREQTIRKEVTVRGSEISLAIGDLFFGIAGHPHLWSPEDPYLYGIEIRLGEDTVRSVFGLRTIEVRERRGREVPGVFLNGKRVFLNGVLDQGYFKDGIYTPTSNEEYARDILRMKDLGFNMLRKHIKIEPEPFYYLCDVLGMFVMQDMVNNGHYRYIHDTVLPTAGFHMCPHLSIWKTCFTKKLPFLSKLSQVPRFAVRIPQSKRETFRRAFFESRMKLTLRRLYNHPSVIAYTIFNEGWGQFESDRLYSAAKRMDPGRIYDTTSGWFAGCRSDFDSVHVYFRNVRMHPGIRPLLISEAGGYTCIPETEPQSGTSYGYGTCENPEDLTSRIEEMYRNMIYPAIPEGLAGCIYTQLSDIEEEQNGLYTYDRSVCKVIPERIRKCGKLCKFMTARTPTRSREECGYRGPGRRE